MSKLHGIPESFPLHPVLCREKETVPRDAWSLGFFFQALLFTSRARELPAANWENAPAPRLAPAPRYPTLAEVLHSKKLHLQTSFHDYSAVRRNLASWSGGSPQLKSHLSYRAGCQGTFQKLQIKIPSAAITKLTNPELQSLVTARLKHFLYTFSARLPLPPSAGLSQQVIPERPERAWAVQPSLQLQTDEEARPRSPTCLCHTHRRLPVLN